MKKTALLIGLGVAAVAVAPVLTSAFAQSAPPAQTQPQTLPDQNDQSNGAQMGDGSGGRDTSRADDEGQFRRRHARHGRGHHNRSARMMRRFDTNGDGKVTKAEFDAAMTMRFDKLDLNKDGVITSDELAKASGRRQARWNKSN